MREGSVLVGKYRVERVLGQGGMGVVVAARHEQLDDRVAIKLMLPAIAANTEAVTRFVREARAAAKIKSEHVARVSDVGTLETGEPYMVMEYLEGDDLSVVLQRQGRLSLDQAADFVLQACEAIVQAHELGIVHRDLKPANLYVVSNRRDGLPFVKVLDFGISKMASSAIDSSMTKTSALMGSPLYMSPEHLNSARDVDQRTDIWSLGVILYELLAGHPPFNGDTLPQVCTQILTGPTPDIRAVVADLPDGVVQVIARCLERDPARRFPNVDELATALAPFSPWGTWKRASRLTNPGNRVTPAAGAASTPGAGSGTNAAWGEAPRVPLHRVSWGIAAAAFLLLVGGAGVALALRWKATLPAADIASAASPRAVTADIALPTQAPSPAASPTTAPVVVPVPVVASAEPKVAARAATAAGTGPRPAAVVRSTSVRPAPAPTTTIATQVSPAKEPPPALSKTPASTGSLGGRL